MFGFIGEEPPGVGGNRLGDGDIGLSTLLANAERLVFRSPAARNEDPKRISYKISTYVWEVAEVVPLGLWKIGQYCSSFRLHNLHKCYPTRYRLFHFVLQ